MGIGIESSAGYPYGAKVDEENRLQTLAITRSMEHHCNQEHGDAYSIPFSVSANAADDCVFYMKNTSEIDVVIEGITYGYHTATANDSIYFKLGDSGTRDNAATVTPVNLNTDSGHTATGDFETGIHLNDGTLAGGSEFERILLTATEKPSSDFNFGQDVIVKKSGVFTIYIGGSGTGTYFLTINLHYHD